MLILFILALLLALWACFLAFIDRHQRQTPSGKKEPSPERIDIIVAARNEAEKLPILYLSLLGSTYPSSMLRLIVINDHSDDDTREVAKSMALNSDVIKVEVLDLEDTGSGKKAALRLALDHVTAPWVYFTDADCRVQKETISGLWNQAHLNDQRVSFGAVLYEQGRTVLTKLLTWENFNTMAVTEAYFTLGKPLMANAANMLLHESLLVGYREALDRPHPGGDDVFFVQQLKGGKGLFRTGLESAVVTEAPSQIIDLIQQRVRWASKTSHYPSLSDQFPAALTFMMSIIQILVIAFGLVMPRYFIFALGFLVVKWLLEYTYQFRWFKKYGKRFPWAKSLSLTLLYPLLVVVVGVASLSKLQFQWKGRSYRSTRGQYTISPDQFTP